MNQQFGSKASGYLEYLINDELAAFMKDAAPCVIRSLRMPGRGWLG
jgi:hypothetical protein